jgi:hypothetical protein
MMDADTLLQALVRADEQWGSDAAHSSWDGTFISFANARGLKPPLLEERVDQTVQVRDIDQLAELGKVQLLDHQPSAGIERRFSLTASGRQSAPAPRPFERASRSHDHDVFISHADEDKETVARPLAQALVDRGWTVWLDELELTVGDSLHGTIEAALARSRFGVVVLSPAFFAKTWPQRELAGLAAREVDAGTKVILPVWHNVNRAYLVAHAPTLADRLGAPTSDGMRSVVEQIARALERAESRRTEASEIAPVLQAVVSDAAADLGFAVGVPVTSEEQERLLSARPEGWEYLLFAGMLLQGMNNAEPKWRDHELRIPRGQKREIPFTTDGFRILGRETGWVANQLEARNRVFGQSVQERAFGPPGEPGDPVEIEYFASGVVATYEVLLDWAAEIRNLTCPSDWVEVRELIAQMVDQPIRQIRTFINRAVEEFSRLPALLAAQRDGGEPVRIHLVLALSANDDVINAFQPAFDRAVRALEESL